MTRRPSGLGMVPAVTKLEPGNPDDYPCERDGVEPCPSGEDMIRDGAELKAARQRLGWSLSVMAQALGLTGEGDKAAQYVREMENGARSISGPVARLVGAFLEGYRPEGFSE